MLATFDVFETVLVRAVSPHQVVFDLVGDRARSLGLTACSAFAFSRAREGAERRAQRGRGDAMSLADIYAEVARTLSFPDETAAALAALEMETEADLLRPVPTVRPLLEAARREAGRIVFVSDMYLPAVFIEEQLRRHGFWDVGDVLYVSHTHGHTKRTGRLFEVVAETERVAVTSIRHHGNNPESDVKGARRAGSAAVSLGDGNPNRFERLLDRYRHTTNGLAPALAGASRLARLQYRPASSHERALVDVAAGVISPILTTYVLWVLQRADALGLRRLYFISRDGQVLLRIAQQLAPRMGSRLELRYLYASRLAWNRAVACPDVTPQVWKSLIDLSTKGVANRDILDRLGLDDRVAAWIVADSARAEEWAATEDRTVLMETLDHLREDGTLRKTRAVHERRLSRYLDQERLFDDVPHGFVDVGWRGSQHDVLLELQDRRSVSVAQGLFFGLEASPSSWGDRRDAYLFDTRAAGRDSTFATPFNFIEMFCAGDHGTVVGYRESDSGVVPVLGEANAALESWGLPLVREVVDSYVAALTDDALRSGAHANARPALGALIEMLWEAPTAEQAKAWGDFPWEVGMGRRGFTVPFAPPLRLREIARHASGQPSLLRKPEQAISKARTTEWPQASWTRSRGLMKLVGFRRLTVRSWLTGATRLVHRLARKIG